MPSSAYAEFLKNTTDVGRLIAAHTNANHPRPGKRALGHLTRGGLLLLCAAWERYVETVVEESAEFLTRRLPAVGSLPAEAGQRVGNHANDGRNAWTRNDLRTDAWKTMYLEIVRRRTENLNTPKYENIRGMCVDFLGVVDIATAWDRGTDDIDEFVTHRGDVAHRGSQSPYVRIGYLSEMRAVVSQYVRETDNFLSDHLRTLVVPVRRPWNRTSEA